MENLMYFIYSLVLPIVFVIVGLVLYKRPPKFGGLGYRTAMAEKNPYTWHTAQLTGGRTLAVFYGISLPFSALATGLAALLRAQEDTALLIFFAVLAVQVLLLIPVIAITERTLRRSFDSNGEPLNKQ